MMDHELINAAKSLLPEMVERRRDLHRHPEIGFAVQRTAKIVADELRGLSLTVREGIGQTGVVADLMIPGAVKTVALRADMDALPIQELNEVEYKSIYAQKAHLCGHDAHTTMLLGAARLLCQRREDLKANVRFIFQPSEEGPASGALAMLADDVLDGVDSIYALHVWPTIDVGCYGICSGPAMAQGDCYDIYIEGRGGHAAAPHHCTNPIYMAADIIHGLQSLVARVVAPSDSAVITVTRVESGTCYNVVEKGCRISGTVRTYAKETQQKLRHAMELLVHSAAKAHGAEGRLDYLDGVCVTFNDIQLADHVQQKAASLVGRERVFYPGEKVLYGEDFGFFSEKVKGCFIQLGCRNVEKGIVHMLHHPNFNIDEECMVYGVALFSQLAMEAY